VRVSKLLRVNVILSLHNIKSLKNTGGRSAWLFFQKIKWFFHDTVSSIIEEKWQPEDCRIHAYCKFTSTHLHIGKPPWNITEQRIPTTSRISSDIKTSRMQTFTETLSKQYLTRETTSSTAQPLKQKRIILTHKWCASYRTQETPDRHATLAC